MGKGRSMLESGMLLRVFLIVEEQGLDESNPGLQSRKTLTLQFLNGRKQGVILNREDVVEGVEGANFDEKLFFGSGDTFRGRSTIKFVASVFPKRDNMMPDGDNEAFGPKGAGVAAGVDA